MRSVKLCWVLSRLCSGFQGAMFVSDAMMIPSASMGTSLRQVGGGGGVSGRGALGTRAAATGTSWVGPSWPLAGSGGASLGRGMPALGLGTSPFGKSVDMVDVCTQLMEGERAVLPAPPPSFCPVALFHLDPSLSWVQAGVEATLQGKRLSILVLAGVLHIREHRTQLLHGQPAERIALAHQYCESAQHWRGWD